MFNIFTDFLTFFLLFGLIEAAYMKSCSPVSYPRHGRVSCIWENERVVCGSSPPVGSVAEFTCEQFYRLSPKDQRFIECQPNGNWSSTASKCVPDCGLRSEFGGLVANGVVTSLRDFPWHVGIYKLIDGSYEYWCGGSLISESTVITAAHCMWETSTSKLMLVFGKLHRDYYLFENDAQKIKARKIEIPSSYQDASGNYNADVAVIFLEQEVRLGQYSAPVCIDWDQRLTNEHLATGITGMAVGWGLTENETLSDFLRSVTLPIVSNEKCIEEQERDFKKFVTFTSFCAGFKNGTGVCNGDSGGGLVFFDDISKRWYLQGLVSVSPMKKGTPYCDLNFYTIFTKLSIFTKWLKRVIEIEKKFSSFGPFKLLPGKKSADYYDLFGKYFDKAWMKKITYPHTIKMLELAGISKRLRYGLRNSL